MVCLVLLHANAVKALLALDNPGRRSHSACQPTTTILHFLDCSQGRSPALVHRTQQLRLDETPSRASGCRSHQPHCTNSESPHPRTERLHVRLRRPSLRCRRWLCTRPNLQKQRLPTERGNPTRQGWRPMRQQKGMPGAPTLFKRPMSRMLRQTLHPA